MELNSKTKELFTIPEKRRAWVIHQFNLNDKTLASFGRDEAVPRSVLSSVLLNRKYPRIERLIAKELAIDTVILFPERYDEYGIPIKVRPFCEDMRKVG